MQFYTERICSFYAASVPAGFVLPLPWEERVVIPMCKSWLEEKLDSDACTGELKVPYLEGILSC